MSLILFGLCTYLRFTTFSLGGLCHCLGMCLSVYSCEVGRVFFRLPLGRSLSF
ncbi:Unknown protein sequence [Pseudomonas savastanoi pv. phaseolicola]|uniref:hypothetical protein n=1 Tax=Pseudomonas savastanoi TaxID=29438 RepID=UPI0006CCF831|nr:hypothetical protein [Pseudomonas savastanoi]KPB37908.1 Unknown protein sequence [Pseudomonas savastanoi pv. phaseolicola]